MQCIQKQEPGNTAHQFKSRAGVEGLKLMINGRARARAEQGFRKERILVVGPRMRMETDLTLVEKRRGACIWEVPTRSNSLDWNYSKCWKCSNASSDRYICGSLEHTFRCSSHSIPGALTRSETSPRIRAWSRQPSNPDPLSDMRFTYSNHYSLLYHRLQYCTKHRDVGTSDAVELTSLASGTSGPDRCQIKEERHNNDVVYAYFMARP
jgi:hypothetical protein